MLLKRIFFLLAMAVSWCSQAQFQGLITWKVNIAITDPKLKAQADKLNSPEMQAQMKELETKMNDPQFQAMLSNNPELKAMLDKQLEAIRSGNGGNVIQNMLPKSIDIFVKNGNSLSIVKGGAFETETLYQKEGAKTYTIDRKNKTYTLLPTPKEEKEKEYKVTPTEVQTKILGYTCKKYNVEATEQGEKVLYHVWSTTEIKDLDNKQLSKIQMGNRTHSKFLEKIEGVPLKIEASTAQGDMSMEVTGLEKKTLEDSLFALPAGYTQK